jgi:hypothetical protein
MSKNLVAAGILAGGLFALSASPSLSVAFAAPAGLAGVTTEDSSGVTKVRRGGRGGGISRGFSGHRGFARSFRGGHRGAVRSFRGHRGFVGGRHFRSHRGIRYGHRHRHRNFFYGGLPFLGWGLYDYGYYRPSCGWLWRKYRRTGSGYWYRRWEECRYGWY